MRPESRRGSLRVVPALERLRRHTEEIAGEDAPVAQDLPKGAAGAIASGRRERRFPADHERAGSPQAPHQIDVVTDRKAPEASGAFVDLPAAEDPLIAEGKA